MSYYIDLDAYGDDVLWSNRPNAENPRQVASRPGYTDELWNLLTAGARAHNHIAGIQHTERERDELARQLDQSERERDDALAEVRHRGLAYRYLTSITTGHALSDHDRRRLHRAVGVLAPEDTEDVDPPATAGTTEYNARVARRNANADRITHGEECEYPGEVDDNGLRCTNCGAEATR